MLEFFASLDLPIHEIYGQSRGHRPDERATCPAGRSSARVGPPLPGIEVKLADDGEILDPRPERVPRLLQGARGDRRGARATAGCAPATSARSTRDGFLTITGRKKEIIITAGGKNIAPKNIEAAIKESPLVGEAVVIGDRRKYLTALVTLERGAAREGRRRREVALGDPGEDRRGQPVARARRAGQEVRDPRAAVRRSTTGELTPTMKIKRKVVAQKYAREIEAMYADENVVAAVWRRDSYVSAAARARSR